MKYLKKFENHAAYAAAESGLILPNVSLCVQEGDVHYKPYVDPCQQHDYVEIGGLKWATKNVGACDVTDYGLYFQWGDTQGYAESEIGSGSEQKYFGWNSYKYSDNGTTAMTKYNATDGKTVLEPSDDAATAAWGEPWRMPTSAEVKTLTSSTNVSLTNDYKGSGVKGFIVTDKTDSSKELFLPLCGYGKNGGVTYKGSMANYWASEVGGPDGKRNARCYGGSSSFSPNTSTDRYFGLTIRPVAD